MSVEVMATPRWSNAVSMLTELAAQSQSRADFRFLDESGEEVAHRSVVQLAIHASLIAHELHGRFAPGSRVILACSAGLDFIDGFFGCLMAGMIAVPLPLPKMRRVDERFSSVIRDCAAAACLTTHDDRDAFKSIREMLGRDFDVLEIDCITNENRKSKVESRNSGSSFDCLLSTFDFCPDQIAYLQYTSGSTGTPRGAIITHRNLMANLEMIASGFEFTESERLVSWLPHYHDMGLVGDTLSPLYCGMFCVKMSPQSFMREPLSWLRAVTKYQATTIGAPNFAYDLCSRVVSPETLDGLDLSSLDHAYCGAEPIHPDTAHRFRDAFAQAGFNPNAFRPCYGLAEATLCVTVGQRLAPLKIQARPESSADSRENQRPVIGCGQPVRDCEVQIIDPQTGDVVVDDRIGEVVISGENVTCGYWGQFNVEKGRLAPPPQSRALATGDLGFMSNGELYITGRKKDMIIVGGRNLYPQDLERTATKAHTGVEGCAAFAIEADGCEKVIVIAEISRTLRSTNLTPVRRAIHQSVLKEHDVSVADVVFVNPLSIPRTSSGKIRRFACREQYLSQKVSGMIQTSKPKSSPAVTRVKPALLRSELRPVSPDPSELVTTYIRNWASRNLGIEPELVTSSSKLSDLGLDSLRTVELQLSLVKDCGLSVSPSAFVDGLTVGQLVDRSSQFVVPHEPPLAILPARETVDLRFNVMPDRFVREVLYTKAYRIWKGYAEAVFDRDYKSEMLASPDHLVFLTALTHTQKLAYICMAFELGFSHEAQGKEQFKFWPTDVRVTMPQMVTQSADLQQQLWVYDRRHVAGNKYQVKCRTLIGSMEILIDSTMLMLEAA